MRAVVSVGKIGAVVSLSSDDLRIDVARGAEFPQHLFSLFLGNFSYLKKFFRVFIGLAFILLQSQQAIFVRRCHRGKHLRCHARRPRDRIAALSLHL